MPKEVISRRAALRIFALGGTTLFLEGCAPGIVNTLTALATDTPGSTQTAPVEATPTVSPTATATQIQATATELPTATSTPEPTITQESIIFPEGFPSAWQLKIRELIDQGAKIKVEGNAEIGFEVFSFVDDKLDKIGNIEADSEIMKITTAKNEPFKVNAADVRFSENEVQIYDDKSEYIEGGGVLLRWKENKWASDNILYLMVGPKMSLEKRKSVPMNVEDLIDIEGNVIPTGRPGQIQSVLMFTGILVDEDTLGLYDRDGYLHQYNISLEDEIYTLCEVSSETARTCRIAGKEELVDKLNEWDRDKVHRLIQYDILESADPEFITFLEAMRKGEGFPVETDNLKIILHGIREFTSQINYPYP